MNKLSYSRTSIPFATYSLMKYAFAFFVCFFFPIFSDLMVPRGVGEVDGWRAGRGLPSGYCISWMSSFTFLYRLIL